MADSPWKSLDAAPRKDANGKPVPVILFLPSAWRKLDTEGRPTEIAHGRVVGWWSDQEQAWVTGTHPDNNPHAVVYPSLWADLPADPTIDPSASTIATAAAATAAQSPQPEAPAASQDQNPPVRAW